MKKLLQYRLPTKKKIDTPKFEAVKDDVFYMELKKEVNEWADPDKSGKDFFTLWMDQAKESEKESEEE